MADFTGFQISLGSTSYPLTYNAFVAALQPYATEIEAGRQGQVSLAANFARYIVAAQGLTANLSAGGQRITDLPAPVAANEPATKGYADGLSFASALPDQTGQGGLVPRTASGVTAWDNWWGPPSALTSAGTLLDRTAYHADTAAGAFSVNLPALAAKSWVLIRDVGRALATNPITLVPNGADTVYGAAQNYLMDTNGETLLLVADATKGWVRG